VRWPSDSSIPDFKHGEFAVWATRSCGDYASPPAFRKRTVAKGSLLVKITASAIVICLIFAACWTLGYNRAPTSAQTNSKNEIERGRYLVEEVAKCAQCHTPRGQHGNLKKEGWLQGAPIWITLSANSELARSSAGAGGISQLCGRTRRTCARKGNWAAGRGASATDARLPHEAPGCEGDYCLSEFVATRPATSGLNQ